MEKLFASSCFRPSLVLSVSIKELKMYTAAFAVSILGVISGCESRKSESLLSSSASDVSTSLLDLEESIIQHDSTITQDTYEDFPDSVPTDVFAHDSTDDSTDILALEDSTSLPEAFQSEIIEASDCLLGDHFSSANPFNPLVQSIAINFHNKDFLNSISAGIYDQDGFLVRQLLNDEQFKIGFQHIEWDGKDSNGSIVPFGEYEYRIVSQQDACTQAISGKIKAQLDAEKFCPPDSLCIHRLKHTQDIAVDDPDASPCLDFTMVNSTNQPLTLQTWMGTLLAPNSDQEVDEDGLLDSQGYPNFYDIEISIGSVQPQTILGPAKLSTDTTDPYVDVEQIFSLSDWGKPSSLSPQSYSLSRMSFHAKYNDFLSGEKVICAFSPKDGVVNKYGSLFQNLVLTPAIMVSTGDNEFVPVDMVVGDPKTIQPAGSNPLP